MTKKNWLLLEKVFTIASLIHYSGAPLVVILSGGASEGDGGTVSSDFALIQLVFLVIYFINLCLLIIRWKKVVTIIPQGMIIWLLLTITTFSSFWSSNPSLTKTRVIALIGTILFSIYLATRYTIQEQLELLSLAFTISVISSFAFAILLPKYGIMLGVHWGKWRGIYNHKNVLGKFMTPSIITFFLLGWKFPQQRQKFAILCFLSLLLIILSRSSSPLINLIILSCALILLHICRWRSDFLITTVLGISSMGIILYTIFTANAEAIARLFGKDLTLTGRTDFWPLVVDKIMERPWLGYGFGAFWQGLDGPSDYIWYASSFKAPNSHNGYLDLCLELGFVGLSLYLIAFITAFKKSLFYIRKVKTPDGFWPALFLLYITLSNLTESTLFIQNNFFLVIQVAIFLSLNIADKQRKQLLTN